MELLLNQLVSAAQISDDVFEVSYSEDPQEEFCGDWQEFLLPKADKQSSKNSTPKGTAVKTIQLSPLDN